MENVNFYERITNSFRLATEKENYEIVADNINKGIVFRGTNLWILIFAVFLASLSLNINSTAVIIGTILISPLMGPINGKVKKQLENWLKIKLNKPVKAIFDK